LLYEPRHAGGAAIFGGFGPVTTRAIASANSSCGIFKKGHFHMPVTIAAEQSVASVGGGRTAYVFLRNKITKVILVVWGVTVLLIGAYAGFGTQSAFLSAFDVSVAPF
jgi:hypothetical protein